MNATFSASAGSRVILAALCFMIQPHFSGMVSESVKVESTASHELPAYSYTGRDENGRATFSYGRD